MSKIPNTEGPIVKKGDLVKITQGEWIGFVGEIVEMVQDGKNIIKTAVIIMSQLGFSFTIGIAVRQEGNPG